MMFMAVGTLPVLHSAFAYTSDDGIDWLPIQIAPGATGADFSSIVWDAYYNAFIITGVNACVYASYNGINFYSIASAIGNPYLLGPITGMLYVAELDTYFGLNPSGDGVAGNNLYKINPHTWTRSQMLTNSAYSFSAYAIAWCPKLHKLFAAGTAKSGLLYYPAVFSFPGKLSA
jgi:hypothetical protein